MSHELNAHEQGLRKLPLPYSLALRLRDAGVAAEVVAEYLAVEEASMERVYRIAEAKLIAVQEQTEVDTTRMARPPA
jgi:hypothetical protein